VASKYSLRFRVQAGVLHAADCGICSTAKRLQTEMLAKGAKGDGRAPGGECDESLVQGWIGRTRVSSSGQLKMRTDGSGILGKLSR
jgi:hypothetical protein